MSKQENTLSESVAMMGLTVVGIVYRGLVAMISWSWLVADRLGTRRLTFAEATIMVWIASVLVYRSNLKKDPEGPMLIAVSVGINIVGPTIALILAALAKAIL